MQIALKSKHRFNAPYVFEMSDCPVFSQMLNKVQLHLFSDALMWSSNDFWAQIFFLEKYFIRIFVDIWYHLPYILLINECPRHPLLEFPKKFSGHVTMLWNWFDLFIMKRETNPTDKSFGISEDEHLNLIIVLLFLFYITEISIWNYSICSLSKSKC